MSHLDPDREIYPNAPLKLVAFELRFPAPIDFDQAQAAFARTVNKSFPIPGPPPHVTTFGLGPAGPTIQQHTEGVRRLDRRRRNSVVFAPEALIVETSAYGRFEQFAATAGEALAALATAADVVAALRIGLRYIDEIDIHDLPAPVRWADYIEPALLGPLEHFGREPRELQVASVFQLTEEQRVILRYGVVEQPVVDPNGPLIIDRSAEDKRFLIDIDSSWEAPKDNLPEFDPEAVLDELARLHQPVREYFESTITDKLKDDLLRKEHL